jgi:hypothetical protein
LTRTWAGANGDRMFLTRDDVYGARQVDNYWQYYDTVALNLLRQVTVLGKLAAQRLDVRTFAEASPRSIVYDGDRIYMTIGNYPYYWGYYGGGVDIAVPVGAGGVASAGTADTGATAEDTSDRLAVLDLSQGLLTMSYDLPTGLASLDLMGIEQNKLFVNLQGDGILVVDVTSATDPKAVSFYRTLGWASGIEFAGTSAYVPAYYYGTYRIDLGAPGNL